MRRSGWAQSTSPAGPEPSLQTQIAAKTVSLKGLEKKGLKLQQLVHLEQKKRGKQDMQHVAKEDESAKAAMSCKLVAA